MEDAFQAFIDVMELKTAETETIVMNRTAMVSHWWNFQFRVVYLNWIIVETDSRVDFMVYYEWASLTKFLLAFIYWSPRRHSNSFKPFKNRKKLKYIFMSISGLAESFKRVVLNPRAADRYQAVAKSVQHKHSEPAIAKRIWKSPLIQKKCPSLLPYPSVIRQPSSVWEE